MGAAPFLTPATFRELVRLAVKYGVGALIAVFLVYKLAGDFQERLLANERQVAAIGAQLEKHNAAMERAEVERRADDRLLRTILRGICLGTSGDVPQARALCDVGAER